MRILLLRYNKVVNESLNVLDIELKKRRVDVVTGNIQRLGSLPDLLPFAKISTYLSSFLPLNAVIFGDVFWPSGQHVCSWCKRHQINSYFLQHGQWIYVKNKMELPAYPDFTLLFGDDVVNMCKSWIYGKHSEVITTGCPRYDDAKLGDEEYVFFSPPVISELNNGQSKGGRLRKGYLSLLKKLAGIDKETRIMLQPHYREEHLNTLFDLFPNAEFALPSSSTLKLVQNATRIITSRNSTVILDAIAYHKPVVVTELPDHDMSFFARGYFGPFVQENKSLEDFRSNVLQSQLESIDQYNEKARRYILLDNASRRIVDLLVQ